MKAGFSCTIFLFLAFGLHASNAHDLFLRGQRAYDAGLYTEAAETLKQALEECDDSDYNQVGLCLARAYYECGKYMYALSILDEIGSNDDTRLLAALAHKHLNHLFASREILETCSEPLAKWHLGHIAYLQGDEAVAQAAWSKLVGAEPQNEICLLAELFLARLDLSAGRTHRARDQLKALEPRIPKPLSYECAFYLGLAEQELQNWLSASEAYQRALPKRNQLQAAWVPDTLKRLASCHLELAEQSQGAQSVQHLKKAESSLRRLQNEFPKEDSQLALATFLARKGRLLNDPTSSNEANNLLSASSPYSTFADRNLMLLLRAEAAPNYETRRFFYTELLHHQEKDSPEYIQCLLLSAQNDLHEGKLHTAIQKLQNAPAPTPEILLEISRICALINSPEAQEQGLAAIRQLDNYAHPDLPYLLEGILISQSDKEDPSLSWKIAIENYPDGKYADECFRYLGSWLYTQGRFIEANQTFLELVARYPTSPHCGEALYWMARAQENSGAPRNSVQRSLREVYENYPQSSFAPEAYLTMYTYPEYLNHPAARAHLSAMKTRFPHSPLTINAQYLLGLSLRRLPSAIDKRKSPTSRWHQAIEAFQEAESTFDRLYTAGMIPEQNLPRSTTLRCRAKLERALVNLAIASEAIGAKKRIYFGYTSDLFRELIADLENAPWKNDALDPIREEASYGLVMTLVRNGDEATSGTLLNDLVARYESSGVSRGYFLSRILYQKGQHHLRIKEYEQGLSFLMQAEEAAKGNLLSPEEKLDLWLAQSHCLQQMDRLDEAMLILSKVINEDAVSGLRVKAMLLRAEIYQKQGRHELAQKQLEATARKGGEWALNAKEKLEHDYGYE